MDSPRLLRIHARKRTERESSGSARWIPSQYQQAMHLAIHSARGRLLGRTQTPAVSSVPTRSENALIGLL